MTYAATRWLGYLAAFAVIGATVFRVWLLPRLSGATAEQLIGMNRRAVMAARLAAVILALSTLLRLYLQARSMIEADEPVSAEIVRLVVGSLWGRGWLAQATVALGAMVGWRALARTDPPGWADRMVVLAAIGLVLTVPLTGHAIGLPAAGRLGYPMTALHVGAGAVWLGTLGVIVIAVIRPADPTFDLAPLIRAYSGVALPAGLVTIGCGLVVGWRYVGDLGALFSTEYGNMLLGKIGALAGIAATGAYNWRVVLPRLLAGQVTPLSRSARVEVILGIVLLAVTAVLVSLAAPSDQTP